MKGCEIKAVKQPCGRVCVRLGKGTAGLERGDPGLPPIRRLGYLGIPLLAE